METKDLEEIFSEINLDSDSEYCSDSDSDVYFKKPYKAQYQPTPKRPQPPLKSIEFEKYVQDNYEDKIKVLNRSTFHQISRPIVIFFNHYREKCAYHIENLDKLYKLALKYADRIEFIAADLFDIDVVKFKRHSIDSFCEMGSPESVIPIIYAIDIRKRVHEHFSEPQTLECLADLCENLLQDKLFKSQALPETNNSSLVKICVHDNYKELVTNSTKHILLIANYDDYTELSLEHDPNYELVAEQLAPYNVEVVYLNGDKNYMPFELGIACYTTILLIPQNDKSNFLNPILGPMTSENIINDVKSYLKDPQAVLQQIEKSFRRSWYVPLNITPDFNMDFKDLPDYLEENCHLYLKVFEREALKTCNSYIIIAFMDFSKGKCSAQHLKWIDEIYQVAITLTSDREYFIADFKDIDVINPLWKPQDFITNTRPEAITPKVYGLDLAKNKFEFNDFKTPANLFYFAYSLSAGELYTSEPWPNIYQDKLVKTCIADNLNLCISSIKKDIFLAIYHSSTENTQQFLLLLEDIAREVKKPPVKIIKIDARLNYITCELNDTTYPILYFIPQNNKNQRIRFLRDNFSKADILDFITTNVQKEND